MKEEFFEEGTEIISSNEQCKQLIFVVQGHIELQIYNSFGEIYILDTLVQGDIIGMYSILFNEGFLFTAMAKNSVRVLSLDRDFFLEKYEEIEGLSGTILKAEKHVETYGMPICDFKKYSRKPKSPIEKLRRAVEHIIVLNQLNKKTKGKFLSLLG